MENKNLEEGRFNFKDFLTAKSLMDRTKNEYLRYEKVFEKEFPILNKENVFKFLSKYNNIVAMSFMKNYLEFKEIDIKIPKQTGKKTNKKDIVKYLTREEINLMFEELQKLDCVRRNTLLLAISFQGGLRRDELFKLSPNNFRFKKWKEDKTQPLEVVISGKRNKKRIVYMTSDIAEKIEEYIKILQTIRELDKEDPLFYSSVSGKALSSKRWEDILKLIGKRALDKNVTPHMLRHSCAMYLKDVLGWDMEKIAKYLGHDSIQSTMIYARTTDLELKKSFKKGFIENEQ
jgi:integrase/recombinase XerD